MTNIYQSYERLAKIYTGKDGIRVIVRGETFCTDAEKTIIIAEIPEELNKKLHNPSLAGLLHETGHVVHTPSNDESALFKTHHGLLNNIEDIRLYHLGKKKYPGYPSLQTAGLNFIRDTLIIPAIESGEKILGHTYLGAYLQYKESGMDYSFFPPNIIMMGETIEGIMKDAKWKMGEEGYKETLRVTQAILDRLKNQAEPGGGAGGQGEENESKEGEKKESKRRSKKDKENKREKSGRTDKDAKSKRDKDKSSSKEEEDSGDSKTGKERSREDRDSKEQDSGKDNDARGDEGNGRGNGEYNNGNKGMDEDTGNRSEDVDQRGSPEDAGESEYEKDVRDVINGSAGQDSNPYDESLMEIMQGLITSIIHKYKRDANMHTVHPEVVQYDVEERIRDPLEGSPSAMDIENVKHKLSNATKELDSETRKLKARMLPLLIAEKRTSFIYERKEGELDDGGLYKLRKGNGRIYKQRVLGRKPNTAVTILNDISGSMLGKKIKMVNKTLLVIADTLHFVKVPFEILAFTTLDLGSSFIKKDLDKRQKLSREINDERLRLGSAYEYNRTDPLRHIIVKAFNDNYLLKRHLIPQLTSCHYNGDNESIIWARQRLMERKEDRKILFILSDGLPNIPRGDDDLLEEDLKKNVKQIEEMGIEIIGIGILTDAPARFYPTCEIIKSVDEISIKVYNALMTKLIHPKINKRETGFR